jgi:hypothetical protein
MKLPEPAILLTRCRALAALDLILSPEWEYRYYSFNSKWSPGEMMASMRNGCGDEWWMVFSDAGWTALKGVAHEFPAAEEGGEDLSLSLQSACPASIQSFAQEAAFRWDDTGFCQFHLDDGKGWQRANDLTSFPHLETGEEELLRHLAGDASDYLRFAADYYELELPLDAVQHVFDLKPITPDLVARLNPETDWDEIAEELYEEIGYPR